MLLGKHTLDETRDLLAVADYRFKETGKEYDMLVSPPPDLKEDWEKLSAQWAVDRKKISSSLVTAAIVNPFLPASVIATEPEWKSILSYTQFGENTKGSLQDITERISKISGRRIMYENQPSQNSGDVDLELFKVLDEKIRTMDAAAKAVKEGAKDAATSPTGLYIGAGVLGAIVTLGLVKKYL